MTTDIGELALEARNVPAGDLVALLREQQARKADVVAPAVAIQAKGGMLVLDSTEPVLSLDPPT
jgi:hypothetical protein